MELIRLEEHHLPEFLAAIKLVMKDQDLMHMDLDKLHEETELPYKETKTKPLDREEKEYNRALSRVRITIENIFGDIKTFKILSDRYRNKRKRYNVKFKIIAGIVNLKNGFAIA